MQNGHDETIETGFLRPCAVLLGLLALHQPAVWTDKSIRDVWTVVRVRAAEMNRPVDLKTIDLMIGATVEKLAEAGSYLPLDLYPPRS